MTEKVQEEVVDSAKKLVIGQAMLAFLFNLSMGQIWGTINSLQITAHVPLFRIKLPANLRDVFDILVQVVTFDYLNYFVENEDFG